MPDIRPAQWPTLTPAQQRLDNLLATRRPTLQLADERMTLQSGGAAISGDWIALAAGSSRAGLIVTPTLLERWLQPWIGGETLSRLPPALGEAARQAALAPFLTALRSATGLGFTLTETARPTGATQLSLSSDAAGSPSAALYLDPTASAVLTAHLQRLPPVTLEQEPWPTLPVAVTLWIGQTHLTPREFAQIEPGDILLLPPEWSAATARLTLRQGRRWLATGDLRRGQFLIDRVLSTPMSEPVADPAPAPLNPDDLEIRIDFDLGHLTLPLQELRALQPGYSFTLTRPGPQPVRIVAGHQVLGYGELVQIDERLGVRVTTLFPSPDQAT